MLVLDEHVGVLSNHIKVISQQVGRRSPWAKPSKTHWLARKVLVNFMPVVDEHVGVLFKPH